MTDNSRILSLLNPTLYMHPTLRYLTLLTATLSLLACEPEVVTLTTPNQEGFSDPMDLRFSAAEMTKLNEELSLPAEISTMSVTLPRHIRQRTFISEVTNSESDARKAVLGRVLFYDKALSATGETSCATCHLQEKAFADPKAFSQGINGQVTKRNSIALGSVPTFAPVVSGYGSSGDENTSAVEGNVKFFWDERAGTIKEQSEATIQDELEMGSDLHQLSSDLRKREIYQILSMKAFGTTNLTPDRITLALERFTATMVATNTRFDQLRDAELSGTIANGNFTEQELLGDRLFEMNCAGCHGHNLTEPAVNVANNGLDGVYADKGVGLISRQAHDNGVFKVPFLRNVALTGPYMHDGRFETLAEVIDHYSEGIQDHRNLHPLLKDSHFNARRMNFSAEEKAALVAFLEMTTDESLLTDAALSDPFRR